MGFNADFNSDKKFQNAYVRIEKIWGSKSEGWNAWVAIRESKGAAIEQQFHVDIPYVENENPYPALYSKIKELPVFKGSSSIEVEATTNNVDTVVEPVVNEVEVKPAVKKTRKKN